MCIEFINPLTIIGATKPSHWCYRELYTAWSKSHHLDLRVLPFFCLGLGTFCGQTMRLDDFPDDVDLFRDEYTVSTTLTSSSCSPW